MSSRVNRATSSPLACASKGLAARDTSGAVRGESVLEERPAPEAVSERLRHLCHLLGRRELERMLADREARVSVRDRGSAGCPGPEGGRGTPAPRAAGTPRRTDGRRPASIPPSSGPGGRGPRASRRTAVRARPLRAGRARWISSFRCRIFGRPPEAVVRGQQLRRSRPGAEPLALLHHRAQVVGGRLTGRPWAMSLIPPCTMSTCASCAHSSSRAAI